MPAVNGDSGAPLVELDSGKALGIISHYGLGSIPPTTGEGALTPFILSELAKAGWNVELATGTFG